ncbi:MAG: alpha/beta hydrolase [Actinomycetia bacterium]|nr:alpha/beta hydrolase [Actinomycetes bacterium]
MAQDGNYVFSLPDGVERRHVTYRNRYGISIAGDLYLPRGASEQAPGAAVLVGSPYGAVKEQASGLWAAELASRGLIALAYDQSYNGYSGGEPRHTSSTDVFVEDIHAAIDYLGTRELVDRERIGAVGVCASGAFVLTAAQVDPRLKAIVTASIIDISANYLPLYGDAAARRAALADLAEQRYLDFESPSPRLGPLGSPMDDDPSNPMREFGQYYWRETGHHHNSVTTFTQVSDLSFLNFPELAHPDWIEAPTLFVIGEDAMSRPLGEGIAERVPGSVVRLVPGAGHVDLYHRTDLIPLDDIAAFLAQHLG